MPMSARKFLTLLTLVAISAFVSITVAKATILKADPPTRAPAVSYYLPEVGYIDSSDAEQSFQVATVPGIGKCVFSAYGVWCDGKPWKK